MSLLNFRFRGTTLLIIGLTACLLGLVFARFEIGPGIYLVLLSVILAVISFRKGSWATLCCVFFCGFTVGWARGAVVMHDLALYENFFEQKVVVQGIAQSDGTYADNGQLLFDLGRIEVIKPETARLKGLIKVQGFGETAVFRGDQVQVEGRLFATRGARQASISYAEITVPGHRLPFLERIRLGFNAGMQNALPEPLGSFGLGILIGQRATLPKTVNDQLSVVGLTHLIAVSGYNLTIIIRAARRILGKRSKYQSTLVSLLLIGAFLLFTGLSASIVRAAIVSSLSLFAWYYGRTIRPLLLLLLAATITALWSPLYLWSDIGWYLSFLAFYGVLIIAPLVTKRVYKAKSPNAMTALIIESVAAQVMAMPIILYIFGQVSAVGLIANVLLVPLIPLAMLFSLIAGIAGMTIPSLAGWVAWPARLLLTYILDAVTLLSRIPHALLQSTLRWPQMMFIYTVVILLSLVLWHKTKSKNGIIQEYDET
jgi:competence protein ComEC